MINAYQNEIDMLKKNFEMNHPSKRNTNGYAQISKNNKIISLDNLTIGEEITLQSPKTIAVCEIKNLKKQ